MGKAFVSEAKNILSTKEQSTSSKRVEFHPRPDTVRLSEGNESLLIYYRSTNAYKVHETD